MNISVIGKDDILENININDIIYVKFKQKRNDMNGNVLMTASGETYSHYYGDELIRTIEKLVDREFIWVNLHEYIDVSLIVSIDSYMRRIVISHDAIRDGKDYILSSAGAIRVLKEKGYKDLAPAR